MKTKREKIVFAQLPKDYLRLCQMLAPRPIHDKMDFENVTEIAQHFGVLADIFVE